MRQRIRVSALVVRDDALLLVKHVVDDHVWWCPPGGGADGDETLLAVAERELREETSVHASAGPIAYLLDFIVADPPCRNLEVYVLMDRPRGEPFVPANEARYLKEARYIRRDEMTGLTVYPTVLRDSFWDDLASGIAGARYLGVSTIDT